MRLQRPSCCTGGRGLWPAHCSRKSTLRVCGRPVRPPPVPAQAKDRELQQLREQVVGVQQVEQQHLQQSQQSLEQQQGLQEARLELQQLRAALADVTADLEASNKERSRLLAMQQDLQVGEAVAAMGKERGALRWLALGSTSCWAFAACSAAGS